MTDENETSEQEKSLFVAKFDGPRFAQHHAPVRVLTELAVMQKLVEEVARRLFLDTHPDRARVPRGHMERVQLAIGPTEANCYSIPVFNLPTEKKADGPDLLAQCFERIVLLTNDKTARDSAAPAELNALSMLGRSLADDESLTFYRDTRSARIDIPFRQKLAKEMKQSFWRELEIEGEVSALSDTLGIASIVADGTTYEVPFKEKERSQLAQAYQARPLTRVHAVGLAEARGASWRFASDRTIELTDHERSPDITSVWRRLEALAKMREDWRDEDGEPPTDDALASARVVLARLLADDPLLARPNVYPTDEGGVIADWFCETYSADLSFAPDGVAIVLGKTVFKEPPIAPRALEVGKLEILEVALQLREVSK